MQCQNKTTLRTNLEGRTGLTHFPGVISALPQSMGYSRSVSGKPGDPHLTSFLFVPSYDCFPAVL